MKQRIIVLFLAFIIGLPLQTGFMLAAEPFQRKVVITGYYSPLPDQEYYVTGSYEGDKRLNGNGTNGADGTQVYPGLLAAPKDYAFGTKVYLPGIGTGTVHDRGGAIISNYKDPISGAEERVDRIDVWMGKGMEGLARALYYIGVKRAVATVYPLDAKSMVADSIYFPDIDTTPLVARGKKAGTRVAGNGTPTPALSAKEITKYQQALSVLGFYNGSIDGKESDTFDESVFRFQKRRGIVTEASDRAAGALGPQTRTMIEKNLGEFNAAVQSHMPTDKLGKGSYGDEVKLLQTTLALLGYYKGDMNGLYNNTTIEAVFAFQKAQNIADNENDPASGYYGTQTKNALWNAVVAYEHTTRKKILDTEMATESLISATGEHIGFDPIQVESLYLNDSGDEVRKLQEYLSQLGYLNHPVTGYYGEFTKQAVLAFQKEHNIVSNPKQQGAGVFGPSTQAKFALVMQNINKPKIERVARANKVAGVAKRPEPKITVGDGARVL